MAFEARYYDGVKAESYAGTITPGANQLVLQLAGDAEPVTWDYCSIFIPQKPDYGCPLVITHMAQPQARLVIADNSFYAVLAARIPRKNMPFIVISTSAASLFFWLLAAFLLAAAVYWGMPQLAEPVARHFPRSWDKALGAYVVQAVTDGQPVCASPKGAQALNKMINALAAREQDLPPVTANVINQDTKNAFAAPGGRLVVYNGLLKMTQNQEELEGIVAHEMGHIVKRHPTQGLVRSLGLGAVTEMVFAGTGATATSASIANGLFQLRYSRDAEREADHIATQILYNAGVSKRGLWMMLARFMTQEKSADSAPMSSYISTHPPTEERIEAVKNAQGVAVSKKILTNQEWMDLKNICTTP